MNLYLKTKRLLNARAMEKRLAKAEHRIYKAFFNLSESVGHSRLALTLGQLPYILRREEEHHKRNLITAKKMATLLLLVVFHCLEQGQI